MIQPDRQQILTMFSQQSKKSRPQNGGSLAMVAKIVRTQLNIVLFALVQLHAVRALFCSHGAAPRPFVSIQFQQPERNERSIHNERQKYFFALFCVRERAREKTGDMLTNISILLVKCNLSMRGS